MKVSFICDFTKKPLPYDSLIEIVYFMKNASQKLEESNCFMLLPVSSACSLREDAWVFTAASVSRLSRRIVLVNACEETLASGAVWPEGGGAFTETPRKPTHRRFWKVCGDVGPATPHR